MNTPDTFTIRIEVSLPLSPDKTRNPIDDPNNGDGVWTYVLTAACRSGLTVLRSQSHRFPGGGITGTAILAESSLALHTWPEMDFALVEATTCGSDMAFFFFPFVLVVCKMVVPYVFTAVMLENFFDSMGNSKEEEQLDEFFDIVETWKKYDPKCTGRVAAEAFVEVMQEIKLPLGFGGRLPNSALLRRLEKMQLPVHIFIADRDRIPGFKTGVWHPDTPATVVQNWPPDTHKEEDDEEEEEDVAVAGHAGKLELGAGVGRLATPTARRGLTIVTGARAGGMGAPAGAAGARARRRSRWRDRISRRKKKSDAQEHMHVVVFSELIKTMAKNVRSLPDPAAVRQRARAGACLALPRFARPPICLPACLR